MELRFFIPHKLSLFTVLLFVNTISTIAQGTTGANAHGDVTEEYLTTGGNTDWAILYWDSDNKRLQGDNSKSFVFSKENGFTIVSPKNQLCIFNKTSNTTTKLEAAEGVTFWNKEIENFTKRSTKNGDRLALPRPISLSYTENSDYAQCSLLEDNQQYSLLFTSKWNKSEPISATLFYREADEEKSLRFTADSESCSVGENAVLTRIEIIKPKVAQGLRVDKISLNGEVLPFSEDRQDSFSSWETLSAQLEGVTVSNSGQYVFEVSTTKLSDDFYESSSTESFTVDCSPNSSEKNDIHKKGRKLKKGKKSETAGAQNGSPAQHDGLAISIVIAVISCLLSIVLALLALLPLIKRIRSKGESSPTEKTVSRSISTDTDRDKLRRLYEIIKSVIGSPREDQSVSDLLQESINNLKERSKVADALEASSFGKPAEGVSYQDFFNDAAKRMYDYGLIVGDILPKAFPDKPIDIPYRQFFDEHNAKVQKNETELKELKNAILSLFGEPSEGITYTDLLKQRIPQLQAIPKAIGKYFSIEETTYDQLFKNLKDQTVLLRTVEGIVDTEFAGMDENDDCATRLKSGISDLRKKLNAAEKEKQSELTALRTKLDEDHKKEVSNLTSDRDDALSIVDEDLRFFTKKQTVLLKEIASAFDFFTRHIVYGSRFGSYAKDQRIALQSFIDNYKAILADEKAKSIGHFVRESSTLMKRALLDRVSWINAICRLNAYSENDMLCRCLLADGLNVIALHRLYYNIVELAANCGLSMLPYPTLFVETEDESYENDNMDLFISRLYPNYEELVQKSAIVDIIRTGFKTEDEEPVRAIVAYYSKF